LCRMPILIRRFESTSALKGQLRQRSTGGHGAGAWFLERRSPKILFAQCALWSNSNRKFPNYGKNEPPQSVAKLHGWSSAHARAHWHTQSRSDMTARDLDIAWSIDI